MRYGIALVVIAMALVSTAELKAQKTEQRLKEREMATRELDDVIAKSERIIELAPRVRVQARAAALTWRMERQRGRESFRQIWNTIDLTTDDGSRQEDDARLQVLEILYPLDSALAQELIQKADAARSTPSGELADRVSGTNPAGRRMGFLSYQLAEDDVASAATVLRTSLSGNTPAMTANVLKRMRERDPQLANELAIYALDVIAEQPTALALGGLNTLMLYAFPSVPSFSPIVDTAASDRAVRTRFAVVAESVLSRALRESEGELIAAGGFTDHDIGLRNLGLAVVSGALVAIGERGDREKLPELVVRAASLRGRVEPGVRSLVDAQVGTVRAFLQRASAEEATDDEIAEAITRKDFDAARAAISKLSSEPRRNTWTDLLLASLTRYELERGRPSEAVASVRQIKDNQNALRYAVEIARSKPSADLEAQLPAVESEIEQRLNAMTGGELVRAIFSISAETAEVMPTLSEALLGEAVGALNALSEIRSSDQRAAYWDDRANFLRVPALYRSFSKAGAKDVEAALLTASKIANNSVQMAARLSAIEPVIKRERWAKPRKEKKNQPKQTKQKRRE
ncbi:MAG: hypothetical protein QUS14_05980 [Pyrinomonadaceae bacterium]|nr:hypothetical protein [Pyrinomonadaceae bacterium]